MDILGFLRELASIRQEKRDHCKSCIILQEQLNNANLRERRLLDSLTRIPETVPVLENREVPRPITSGTIPWRVKRELLEQEDRARAKAIREAATVKPVVTKPEITDKDTEISISELEKELEIS